MQLLSYQDYLQGLDRSKYELELADAGDDEAKRKTIQVRTDILK